MNWKELFVYDESSPSCLVNKITRSSRNKEGNPTGSLHNYWVVSTPEGSVMAHRIIWELHYGPIPDGMQIDHKDTNKLNNKLDNLRLATRANNQMNQVLRSDNTSGVKGIHWVKRTQVWNAEIWLNRKKVWRCQRKNIEELKVLLEEKRKELHKEFARTAVIS